MGLASQAGVGRAQLGETSAKQSGNNFLVESIGVRVAKRQRNVLETCFDDFQNCFKIASRTFPGCFPAKIVFRTFAGRFPVDSRSFRPAVQMVSKLFRRRFAGARVGFGQCGRRWVAGPRDTSRQKRPFQIPQALRLAPASQFVMLRSPTGFSLHTRVAGRATTMSRLNPLSLMVWVVQAGDAYVSMGALRLLVWNH